MKNSVKSVIVSSGKGGTGKTLISINLALELSKNGRVGLLDADIDSSNFAEFIKTDDKIGVVSEKDYKRFELFRWKGIKVFSMSLLADKEKAVNMMGDRYLRIIDDVIRSPSWGELNYLIVDLPAGASDIFKGVIWGFADSLAGGVIVTQPSSVVDAKRVIKLHNHHGIPILGLIENMCAFECEHKKRYPIFGETQVENLSKEHDVHVFGKIPVSMEIREDVDKGDVKLKNKNLKPIKKACDTIKEMEPEKVGVLEKIKGKVSEVAINVLERAIATLIVTANKNIDIREYKRRFNVPATRVTDIVITNVKGTEVLSRTHFMVKNDKLIGVKKPKHISFEIVSDFKTLARALMGKRKIKDRMIKFDATDAYLSGEIRTYGDMATPYAFFVLKDVLSDEKMMGEVREKFKLLERFV